MQTKKYKRSEIGEKIVTGMQKVHEKLIAEKKRNNSELIVLQGKKIVRIKPE